jgi:hydroxyacylglutathione hydrolase
MWAGSLIPINAELVIVAETAAQVDEATVRLARVGIENVRGYLLADVERWKSEGAVVEQIKQLSVDELKERIAAGDLQVLDVRRPNEYQSGHVPGASHTPLSILEKNISNLDLKPNEETAVICAGGYRSSAAASLMQKHGFTNLVNVTGGTSAWVNAGYPVETK